MTPIQQLQATIEKQMRVMRAGWVFFHQDEVWEEFHRMWTRSAPAYVNYSEGADEGE